MNGIKDGTFMYGRHVVTIAEKVYLVTDNYVQAYTAYIEARNAGKIATLYTAENTLSLRKGEIWQKPL